MKIKLIILYLIIAQSVSAQNISKEIIVKTHSYSMNNYGGNITETCEISIWNTSVYNILITSVCAYKPTTGEVFFIDTNYYSLTSNTSALVLINNNENYLKMGEWIVRIDYLNLNDAQYYIKLAKKKANSYGTNVSLEDVSEYETSVKSIIKKNSDQRTYYDLNGKQVSQPQHGLYIMKKGDGTINKVIIK